MKRCEKSRSSLRASQTGWVNSKKHKELTTEEAELAEQQAGRGKAGASGEVRRGTVGASGAQQYPQHSDAPPAPHTAATQTCQAQQQQQ